MLRYCEVCEKPFEARPYRVKRGGARFCSRKCYYNSPEFKELVSQNGKHQRTPETLAKLSESIKLLWQDPVHKKRISEGRKLLWQDPVHKKRISEGRKLLWQDPVYAKKVIEAFNRKPTGPERQLRKLLRFSEITGTHPKLSVMIGEEAN